MKDRILRRSNTQPLVFQIGFNSCGTKFINRLFAINGYNARRWQSGNIAQDIIYSKSAGVEPLTYWPNTVCFSDMERVHKLHRPLLTAYKEYKFLHQWFPDAIFILNTRNIDDWIDSRFNRDQGLYKDFWAHHLRVDPLELPKIWRAEWVEHVRSASEYFQGYDRFFVCDMDHDPAKTLAQALSPWYDLKKFPSKNPHRMMQKRKFNKTYPVTDKGCVNVVDKEFVESVTTHCLGQKGANITLANAKDVFSKIYVKWDGKKSITNQNGTELPIRIGSDGHCYASPWKPKLDRVEGVINEVVALGLNRPLEIDMQDARWLEAADPVLVYNRRIGAKNSVLWPLPDYHTPGLESFVHTKPIDTLEFDQKTDVAVWRGNMTGRPNVALAPDLEDWRLASEILQKAMSQPSEAEMMGLHNELMGITRYNLVSRLYLSSDFDVALTLTNKNEPARLSPLFSIYCGDRVDQSWFYKSKYILSLSGNDTGSNFLMAANSNSVVLKEEDGWELFYSSAFKPWEHYIPLKLGALDVEEQLDWARANPARCQEISRAATEVCAQFANPLNRRAILTKVLGRLGPTAV